MARSVALAEAIVQRINAGQYDVTFEARRRAVPFYSIDEMAGLEVSVFTGTRAAERYTREEDGLLRTYKPVVAIQKKLTGGDDAAKLAESDQLQGVVEAIEEQIQDVDLLGMSFVGFGEEQDEDAYGVEALRSLGVFAAIIITEYIDA